MAQKVKIALLPCPCCGGDAEYTETCLPDAYSDHEIIACTECHLQMDNASPKEWNRRVQAAQQGFAVGQLPLCPECGETLLEDDRRWECVNESCGNCR